MKSGTVWVVGFVASIYLLGCETTGAGNTDGTDDSQTETETDADSETDSETASETASESDTLLPPMIAVDLSPVWLGEHSIDEEAREWEATIRIKNKGQAVLEIDSVVLRGDQNCAFEEEGPDRSSLGEDETAFILIRYKPKVRADDNVGLVITSNSEAYGTLIVPICGRGVLPEELGESAMDTDANAGGVVCNAPTDDQPDCM